MGDDRLDRLAPRPARRRTRRLAAPASFSSAASFSDTDGSFSDGFSTKQLPVASATGIIHSGTMIGKLNGVIPATTPSG